MPKGGFEPPLPEENCALNAARLPFRHFGTGKASIERHDRSAAGSCQRVDFDWERR